MRVAVVGCNHHNASVEIREKLAFSPSQADDALQKWRSNFPRTEAVLLSTCNRMELYTVSEHDDSCPSHEEVVAFLADYHGLKSFQIFDDLFERTGEDAVRHLFTVAAGLDSMVLGEAQILAQVKQAYQRAAQQESAGPLTHGIFQRALQIAKRVATETTLQQKRVSIPSVAVSDFAKLVFDRFDDKQVLVIGAGEMGEETIRYLQEEGARHITIVNRTLSRAESLAATCNGRAEPWERLDALLIQADLVVSTTGAAQPIVTRERFEVLHPQRFQRPLLILDLAIPRDFDSTLSDGRFLNLYLYDLDDLKEFCEQNRRERERELPRALHIIETGTAQFMSDLYHRATSPVIRRLKEGWEKPKDDELRRLFNKLPELNEKDREEIRQAFDRLVNKLLHPPLESLRDESRAGVPHSLLDAIKRLFKLQD